MGYEDEDCSYINSTIESCNGVPLRNLEHLVNIIENLPEEQASHLPPIVHLIF